MLVVDGISLEILGQDKIVVIKDFGQFLGEMLFVQQFTQTDAAPGDLVFIGRPDATTSSADLLVTFAGFAGLVQGDVIGQDQGAGGTDLQAVSDGAGTGFQFIDFLEQGLRGEHHAIADDAGNLFAQYAGWQKMQNGFFPIDDQGMTSIMTALEAHHIGGLVSQEIDDFSFPLVTPLGTEHDNTFSHY